MSSRFLSAVLLGLFSSTAIATGPPIPVPEPATLSLLAAGFAGIVISIALRRRK